MEDQLENRVNDIVKEDRKRRWQILFVDDHGKMITIKWFKPISFAVLCALLLSVVLCVTLTVLFHSTKKDNRDYTSKIEAYKNQIGTIQTEKDILMAKLVIAESKLNGTGLIGVEKENTPQNSVPLEPKKLKNNSNTLRKKQNSKPEKVAAKNKPENIEAVDKNTGDDDIINGVDIDNLVFTHESKIDLLRTKFIVKNIGNVSDAISGYIFVIFKTDETKPKDWFAIPSVGLVSGKPAFPKRGQYFKIHRFKTVHFKTSRQRSPELYKKATIFVFSEDNVLLMRKTVPVKIETT